MKKHITVLIIACSFAMSSNAQIDLNNLNLKDILGKVMHVKKGFVPKFSLGNIALPKINKVAEILGMKKNEKINSLFNTFRTGRWVFRIAGYAGTAVALYGVATKLGDSLTNKNNRAALATGLISMASGVLVKLLTKAASYKAVDLFNGMAIKKIKDIFSIRPASNTIGIGLYAKLD